MSPNVQRSWPTSLRAITERRDPVSLLAWLTGRTQPEPSGCLTWTGRIRSGQPEVPVQGKKRSLRPMIFDVMVRPRAAGERVFMACRTLGCVAADHMTTDLNDRATLKGFISRRDRSGLLTWLGLRTERQDDGCLRYLGSLADDGYPYRRLHRTIFLVVHGGIPQGDHVHHKCGNAWCLEPAHLALSTARENIAEMLARQSYERRIAHLEDLARRMASELPPGHALRTEWSMTTALGLGMAP